MWKFDLTSRTWSRILASGKYPTPKALATFVQYKDKFVLFGGWRLVYSSIYYFIHPVLRSELKYTHFVHEYLHETKTKMFI